MSKISYTALVERMAYPSITAAPANHGCQQIFFFTLFCDAVLKDLWLASHVLEEACVSYHPVASYTARQLVSYATGKLPGQWVLAGNQTGRKKKTTFALMHDYTALLWMCALEQHGLI